MENSEEAERAWQNYRAQSSGDVPALKTAISEVGFSFLLSSPSVRQLLAKMEDEDHGSLRTVIESVLDTLPKPGAKTRQELFRAALFEFFFQTQRTILKSVQRLRRKRMKRVHGKRRITDEDKLLREMEECSASLGLPLPPEIETAPARLQATDLRNTNLKKSVTVLAEEWACEMLKQLGLEGPPLRHESVRKLLAVKRKRGRRPRGVDLRLRDVVVPAKKSE